MPSDPDKRDSVQRSIVRLVGKINKYINEEESDSATSEAFRKVLSNYWEKFCDLQLEVESVSGKETIDEQQQIHTNTEDLYMDAIIALEEVTPTIVQLPRTNQQSEPRSSSSVVVVTEPLPRLEIPKFDSTYEGWPSFKELFSTIVHTNSKLNGAQRLQYLKQNVRGDAEQLVRQFHTTSDNYELAWEALNARYENKRVIATTHLRRFFRQPVLQSESAVGLRTLLDTSNECLSSLKLLGLPTDGWDALLVFIITERLDLETRRQFEFANPGTELLTYKDLCTFLENRFRSLEATSIALNRRSTPVTRVKSHTVTAVVSDPKSNQGVKCGYCHDQHRVSNCEKYLSLTRDERLSLIRTRGWCYNCLGNGHSNMKCPSRFNCKHCHKKHHSTIHQHEPTQEILSTTSSNRGVNDTTATAMTTQTKCHRTTVLLSTAKIAIRDSTGNWHNARALLDVGAQASFISEAMAHKLRLEGKPAALSIQGLGGSNSGSSTHSYQISIRAGQTRSPPVYVETFRIKSVTSLKYELNIDQNAYTELRHLTLADPTFTTSGTIDVLLGAEVYGSLLQPGLIKLACGLTAQNTDLGWVVFGPHRTSTNLSSNGPTRAIAQSLTVASLHITAQDESLDRILRHFWEVEECQTSSPPLTAEQMYCEEHFTTTHTRTPEGRYIVRLPFLPKPLPPLGNSRQGAISRLAQMERRFTRDTSLRQKYSQFMDEYAAFNHMTAVGVPETVESPRVYLPHHAVLGREGKIRVVFDGSHKSTSGVALNDILAVGPTIQNDLFTILLRWRNHRYVFTADIVKMYRQILIDERDTNFQHILWRADIRQPIVDYALRTVTYGTNSAPFLAVRTLMQLARDEGHKYPLAAKVIENNFYVDDVMAGADDLSSVGVLRDELIELLSRGGFSLSKWASNHKDLLTNLSVDTLKTTSQHKFTDPNQPIKTLGVLWCPRGDHFSFHISIVDDGTDLTKRSLLSQIGRLFDPMEWIAPVIIIAKAMFQRLWLIPLSWDDKLPDDFVTEWKEYRAQLPSLQNISISRWTRSGSGGSYELHAFCDASMTAYAAVVYTRVVDESGHIHTTLITSKTRVAPVQQLSIPRLELCGAMLLAKLVSRVRESFGHNTLQEFYWCDSTIVLAWLSKPPSHWQTFVANRVSDIQRLTTPSNWRHVPTDLNPADCASRGLYPNNLCTHALWWNGPPFLQQDSHEWPNRETGTNTDIERRNYTKGTLVHLTSRVDPTHPEPELLLRYSSLTKLKRTTALITRFISNCRVEKGNRAYGSLRTIELETSLQTCIRTCQAWAFAAELNCCNKRRSLPKSSSLLSLQPFVGSNGLLRVGGRLNNSNLNYQQQHQIILPRESHLTVLIVDHIHMTCLHGGTQLVLTILRQRYWIVAARQYVRTRIHRCMKCFRQKRATQEQLMGALPSVRVTPARPFIKTGVDFAGPVTLQAFKGRCNRLNKGYIAVFVCMATRAIHLELASDLSSATFLAAFRRFASRRGHCTDIYSDNGTNFVGAAKELAPLVRDLKASEGILCDNGTQWHFNPPSSPHFGGIWEAGVRSVKYHLHRVLGDTHLTYEEFNTLLHQIEVSLNSRPLCSMTDDPTDFEALTPGHFLIGEPLLGTPGRDYTSKPLNTLTRWQLVQRLNRNYWERWATDYLNMLQNRPKWQATNRNLNVGDLVLIHEPPTEPTRWTIGRIVLTHPGQDNLVRVVTVKTPTGLLKRPIVKLSLLPLDLNPVVQGGRNV